MHPDSVVNRGIEHIDYQDVHYLAHPEWVDAFKRAGIRLNAWIVNTDEEMDWFIGRGFDYITTDEPERLFGKYREKDEKGK